MESNTNLYIFCNIFNFEKVKSNRGIQSFPVISSTLKKVESYATIHAFPLISSTLKKVDLLNNVFPFPFQTLSASYDKVYPAEEYDNKDVEDNCKYSHPYILYLNVDLFNWSLKIYLIVV